jgi:hypothetical protein
LFLAADKIYLQHISSKLMQSAKIHFYLIQQFLLLPIVIK